jgi:hypothetical protein
MKATKAEDSRNRAQRAVDFARRNAPKLAVAAAVPGVLAACGGVSPDISSAQMDVAADTICDSQGDQGPWAYHVGWDRDVIVDTGRVTGASIDCEQTFSPGDFDYWSTYAQRSELDWARQPLSVAQVDYAAQIFCEEEAFNPDKAAVVVVDEYVDAATGLTTDIDYTCEERVAPGAYEEWDGSASRYDLLVANEE